MYYSQRIPGLAMYSPAPPADGKSIPSNGTGSPSASSADGLMSGPTFPDQPED